MKDFVTLGDLEEKRFQCAKRLFLKGKYFNCIETFTDLANSGHMASFLALGEIYYRGGDGIEKDYVKARRLFEEFHMYMFSPVAIYKLGLIYYNGLGTEVDYKKAYFFFRKLALRRMSRGLIMVGLMHKNAEGVSFKPRFAQRCFYAALQENYLSVLEKLSVKFMMLTNCSDSKKSMYNSPRKSRETKGAE